MKNRMTFSSLGQLSDFLKSNMRSKQNANENIVTDVSLKENSAHLKPSLIVKGSGTSTVLPFEDLEDLRDLFIVVDLSTLEKRMTLGEDGLSVDVQGPVTWKDLKAFAESHGLEVMTSPTEELASVLGGVATSCTGERSFGFRNLRSQVLALDYIDGNGEVHSITHHEPIEDFLQRMGCRNFQSDLKEYQEDFKRFLAFKNGPYPRLEHATDVFIGTEGQLGIVTRVVLALRHREEKSFLYFPMPKWTEDMTPHLKFFTWANERRDRINACEFLDYLSLSFLDKDDVSGSNVPLDSDLLFIEIYSKNLEMMFEDIENYLLKPHLPHLTMDDILVLDEHKSNGLRMSVPRRIFEQNSRMGVLKKGTDVQVAPKDFPNLLKLYQAIVFELKKHHISCNLFGHFGDAHLHFNFMPRAGTEELLCQSYLEKFYEDVHQLESSPFAEHGIGLLKIKFITHYHGQRQQKMFQHLKQTFDPQPNFFMKGFLACS